MPKHSQPTRRNFATVLAHTLFIAMIFVLPELVMTMSSPHRLTWGFYPGFYIKAAFCIAVFYANYLWLVDLTLERQHPRILGFVLINIVVVCVALILNYTIGNLVCEHPRPRHLDLLPEWQRFAKITSWVLRDAVMMVLSIGLAVAMRLSTRWADIQLQKQKLLAAQRITELESLKSQLNPHFLFNTLNSIYALIDINSEDAKKAVHKLSGMLRYMLYEGETEVSLTKETEFVSNYISLMRLRLRSGDHPLEVDIDVSDAAEATVPPLLFIPLVENALKYGLTASPGTPIRIFLGIENGNICCRTSNGFENNHSNRNSGGIGLVNLRRRLVLIYGAQASLHTSVASGIYTAELILPLQMPEIHKKQTNEADTAI